MLQPTNMYVVGPFVSIFSIPNLKYRAPYEQEQQHHNRSYKLRITVYQIVTF